MVLFCQHLTKRLTQIYTQFITRFNWEQGAAFGFLLLGLSTAIVWLGLKFSGQKFGEVMQRS